MKRILVLVVIFFNFVLAFGQTGLEKLLVEKYYVATSEDEVLSEGKLKAGSVTYRIFADLRPQYRLQAVYGIPGHPLKLSTTTSFFNNVEYGGVVANDVSNNTLVKSTVMVDSWLSVGAGSESSFAIPKSADTTSAFVNIDGLLKGEDSSTGVPIKFHDGLIPASPVPVVTMFGIDSTISKPLSTESLTREGQFFYTENGSWANFGGAAGIDSTNMVLIAQLTTDGALSFELNFQLATPFGGTQNLVARNPQGAEIQVSELDYSSEEHFLLQMNQPKKKK